MRRYLLVGKQWRDELSEALSGCNFCLICMTPENLNSTWIHFEAGALAQAMGSKVSTLLFDVSEADISSPLSGYQNTLFEKDDFLLLMESINENISSPLVKYNLKDGYNRSWKELEKEILELINNYKGDTIINSMINIGVDIKKSCYISETRASRELEFDRIIHSKDIIIADANPIRIFEGIRNYLEKINCSNDTEAIEIFQQKSIKIFFIVNKFYTNMIDIVERHDNVRDLLDINYTITKELIKIKKENSLDNLQIGMSLFANSCTIMKLDDVMFITPYTHLSGRESPTFIINRRENKVEFEKYENYLHRLEEGVIFREDGDEDTLEKKLFDKMDKLGLL